MEASLSEPLPWFSCHSLPSNLKRNVLCACPSDSSSCPNTFFVPSLLQQFILFGQFYLACDLRHWLIYCCWSHVRSPLTRNGNALRTQWTPDIEHLWCEIDWSLCQHQCLFYPGGTGGAGGQSNNLGGAGGVGEGPTLNIVNVNNLHIPEGAEMYIRQRDTIINWLSPINFFLRQADVAQMRAKGTGGWLLKHPLFKQWESGSGRTVWCHGIRM
jgi:hypothetical protein